jgi:glutamate racemase
MLQRMLGPAVTLVRSGRSLAGSVAASLAQSDLATGSTSEGVYSFLCTGDAEAFRELGMRFLQMPIESVEQVKLPAVVAA